MFYYRCVKVWKHHFLCCQNCSYYLWQSGKTALIRAIVDNDDDEFVDFTKLLLDAGANMEAQHEVRHL